jgi:RimJ/RimL family protein N-acetyltransferase
VIETQRLILRRWRDADRAPFAAMHEDREVAYWLGGPAFASKVAVFTDRYNAGIDSRGFGLMAIERREDGALLGCAGVVPITQAGLPVGGFEAEWRLARWAWGSGYASEAARACLVDAFGRDLQEIISFTAETNVRSMAVMERIGMVRDPARDFDHPALEEGHPLRRHLVYAARRSGAGG